MSMFSCDQTCKFDHTRSSDHLQHHIERKIPTVIPYELLNIMPWRQNFVNRQMYGAMSKMISLGHPIMFLPITVQERIPEYNFGRETTPLHLYGILPCGSKACVIIEGVKYNAQIMVPADTTADKFKLVIEALLADDGIKYHSVSIIDLYHYKGFSKTPRKWVDVKFESLHERSKFIKKARANPTWETSSDDDKFNTFYYQKLARERRFASASWNMISGYRVSESKRNAANCQFVLRITETGIRKLSPTERTKFGTRGHAYEGVMIREPILTASWDIETRGMNPHGPPTVNDEYTIPTICTSYNHHHSSAPLLRVAVSMYDAVPRAGIDVTIVCGGNQKNTLLAHLEVMNRMAPDVLYAFNGGNFDWPLLKKKIADYDMLLTLKNKLSSVSVSAKDTADKVSKYCFKPETIKTSAENNHTMTRAAFDGLLDVDAMPTFLKLYPKSEVNKMESLNFFLKLNNLAPKEDMPISRMLKIFDRAAAVAGVTTCHCGTDCRICAEKVPELDCKRADSGAGGLSDAVYSDVLHDSYYRPDGARKCCYCSKKPLSAADIAEVNYYCVIDCVQPHKLFVKRTILADAMALASMSYVSLFDAVYRADGMKVYNLIGSENYKRGIAFSNAQTYSEGKIREHFPGAFVFPPNRGLHADGWMKIPVYDSAWKVIGIIEVRARPITGLDYNSLYPSLMMTYDLSPDKKVKKREEMEALVAEGYSVHHIKYDYEVGEKRGDAANTKHTSEAWTVRHNGVVKKDDDRVVERYDKYAVFAFKDNGVDREIACLDAESAPVVASLAGRVYTRTVKYQPVYGRGAKKGERMGVFPYIVMKLFNKRVTVKKKVDFYTKTLEKMKDEKLESVDIMFHDGMRKCTQEDVEFYRGVEDAQQKAIKVLSNTFYGKSGDRTGALYDMDIAAGITSAGQRNIKFVASYVTSKGFRIHYGDTDSLYLSCPDELFAECDAVYDREIAEIRAKFAGVEVVDSPAPGSIEAEYKAARTACRVRWWTEQVAISMKTMKKLQEEVSDYLIADNGCTYLKMAIEEVGMPCFFCGNKKYFLMPHIDRIDFYQKKYMVRGIEVTKQGQSQIAKDMGYEFMARTLSPEFESTPLELAHSMVDRFMKTGLDLAQFTMKARYKPEKQNVSVQTFVTKMRKMCEMYADNPEMKALYAPPEGGDKFDFVVVKREQQYTSRGNIIDTKKGDKMEYTRVYRASQKWAQPLEIDLVYYFKNMFSGVLARFIQFGAQFQPAGQILPDKEYYKAYDAKCGKNAKKYLIDYAAGIYNPGPARADVGRRYKRTFKIIDKILGEVNDYGADMSDYTIDDVDAHMSDLRNLYIDAIPAADVDKIVAQLLRKFGDIYKLRDIYVGNRFKRGVIGARGDIHDRLIEKYSAEFAMVAPVVARFAADYNKRINEFISEVRQYDDEEVSRRVAGAAEIAEVPPDISEKIATLGRLSEKIRGHAYARELLAAVGRKIVAKSTAATGSYKQPTRADIGGFLKSPIVRGGYDDYESY